MKWKKIVTITLLLNMSFTPCICAFLLLNFFLNSNLNTFSLILGLIGVIFSIECLSIDVILSLKRRKMRKLGKLPLPQKQGKKVVRIYTLIWIVSLYTMLIIISLLLIIYGFSISYESIISLVVIWLIVLSQVILLFTWKKDFVSIFKKQSFNEKTNGTEEVI